MNNEKNRLTNVRLYDICVDILEEYGYADYENKINIRNYIPKNVILEVLLDWRTVITPFVKHYAENEKLSYKEKDIALSIRQFHYAETFFMDLTRTKDCSQALYSLMQVLNRDVERSTHSMAKNELLMFLLLVDEFLTHLYNWNYKNGHYVNEDGVVIECLRTPCYGW